MYCFFLSSFNIQAASRYYNLSDGVSGGSGTWHIDWSSYVEMRDNWLPDQTAVLPAESIEHNKEHEKWGPDKTINGRSASGPFLSIHKNSDGELQLRLWVQHTWMLIDSDHSHSSFGNEKVLCEGDGYLEFPSFRGGRHEKFCVGDTSHGSHKDAYTFSVEWRRIKGRDFMRVYWNGVHRGDSNLINLSSFVVTKEDNIKLVWITSTEVHNAGFRIWRITSDDNSEKYHSISILKKLYDDRKFDNKLIAAPITSKIDELLPAEGNEKEKTIYSYVDMSAKKNNVSFYYLLEDIDTDGNRTFHCSEIRGITMGQGPIVDEESAIVYCMNQCLVIQDQKVVCK